MISLISIFLIHLQCRHIVIHKNQMVIAKGQIVTPLKYPLNRIQPAKLELNGQNFDIETDIRGNFSVQIQPSSQAKGILSLNFNDQFSQQFDLDATVRNNIADFGQLTLDNHRREQLVISGYVQDSETNFTLEGAIVNLNFSQPVWLDDVNSTTNKNGLFNESLSLLQMIIYGVQIQIYAQGYQVWDCSQQLPQICSNKQGLPLYNQFQFQFPNNSIKLETAFVQSRILVKVMSHKTNKPQSGIQVSALCQTNSYYYTFEPRLSEGDGLVVLDSQKQMRRFDSYFCVIWTYTNPVVSLLIEFGRPLYVWDGTINEKDFLWI